MEQESEESRKPVSGLERRGSVAVIAAQHFF
jgi:hypothetical protein